MFELSWSMAYVAPCPNRRWWCRRSPINYGTTIGTALYEIWKRKKENEHET